MIAATILAEIFLGTPQYLLEGSCTIKSILKYDTTVSFPIPSFFTYTQYIILFDIKWRVQLIYDV
jgi:hypothetical protein